MGPCSHTAPLRLEEQGLLNSPQLPPGRHYSFILFATFYEDLNVQLLLHPLAWANRLDSDCDAAP